MCSGRRERRRLGGVHGTRYLFLLESAPSRGRDGGEGVGAIVVCRAQAIALSQMLVAVLINECSWLIYRSHM